MFFGLAEIDDHPCYKMQDVVENFFLNSIEDSIFSPNLFPEWVRTTLDRPNSTLKTQFSAVHALLHANGVEPGNRHAIYSQLHLTNQIKDLCDGTVQISDDVINWDLPLGKSIKTLMVNLYDSLDLVVFRKEGELEEPTHHFYKEFINKNKYICPFCGIAQYKNKKGPRREDLDHYLHKSKYPLAAANMKNLIPTCGTCNQDHKKTHDILADGSAFYPYGPIPEVRLEIDCVAYPATDNFGDKGQWVVKLELVIPDIALVPNIQAWDRVYSIKKRLINEVQEFFEEWIEQILDRIPNIQDEHEFRGLIASAKARAEAASQRRMEPSQIVRAAFYDFILNRAEKAFVKSYWYSKSSHCVS